MATVQKKKVETLFEKYLMLNEENKKKILDMSRILVHTQNTVIQPIREDGPDKEKKAKR
jgi:hypothetical protein